MHASRLLRAPPRVKAHDHPLSDPRRRRRGDYPIITASWLRFNLCAPAGAAAHVALAHRPVALRRARGRRAPGRRSCRRHPRRGSRAVDACARSRFWRGGFRFDGAAHAGTDASRSLRVRCAPHARGSCAHNAAKPQQKTAWPARFQYAPSAPTAVCLQSSLSMAARGSSESVSMRPRQLARALQDEHAAARAPVPLTDHDAVGVARPSAHRLERSRGYTGHGPKRVGPRQ